MENNFKAEEKALTRWVGSSEIPVRIDKENLNIVCKIHNTKSETKKKFASYIIKDDGQEPEFISFSECIELAKFKCNLALAQFGYSVNFFDI